MTDSVPSRLPIGCSFIPGRQQDDDFADDEDQSDAGDAQPIPALAVGTLAGTRYGAAALTSTAGAVIATVVRNFYGCFAPSRCAVFPV